MNDCIEGHYKREGANECDEDQWPTVSLTVKLSMKNINMMIRIPLDMYFNFSHRVVPICSSLLGCTNTQQSQLDDTLDGRADALSDRLGQSKVRRQ